jgi:glycerol-3-phosphate cytidylyltransferase
VIRVYTDMAADVFHIGHLNLLKKAKAMGDYLIVGVHSDEQIASYKRRPIFSEQDRYEIMRGCRYVDEVIEAAPLVMTKDFLLNNKIDLVVRGDDTSQQHLEQQADPIDMGIMRYVPRTPGISTSDIIDRIVGEYRNE